MKKLLCLALCVFVLAGAFAACSKNADELWKDAVYTEDTELGEGAKTVKVTVSAGEDKVVFTIKTDAETLGDALDEHRLVEGEESEFGLYVKKVNGILADYDVDATYWALSKDGKMLMSGVDTTNISDGESYELTKTK